MSGQKLKLSEASIPADIFASRYFLLRRALKVRRAPPDQLGPRARRVVRLVQRVHPVFPVLPALPGQLELPVQLEQLEPVQQVQLASLVLLAQLEPLVFQGPRGRVDQRVPEVFKVQKDQLVQ